MLNLDNVLPIMNQMLILFLLMAAGYAAQKKRILDAPTNARLSDFLTMVTLPAMLVSSFAGSDIRKMLVEGGSIVAVSFATFAGSILLGWVLFRKTDPLRRQVLWCATVFSNSIFIGYPVLQVLYGDAGIVRGAFYNIGYTVFFWTFGYSLFAGKGNTKGVIGVLTNPGMIGLVVGMLLSYLRIQLPDALATSLSLLGGLTTPLAMVVIGSTLALVPVREVITDRSAYFASFLRLLLVPIVLWGIMVAFRATPEIIGTCVITAAMPVGASAVLFAGKFGGDAPFASRVVFISTVLSMLTIPVFMVLVS